ncbi:MAG: Holliday junction resolvase [Candidatus Diapherotrites archaeon]|nr:Holliday junction resolvase [Candidatus Diapherotrites archaeon]
MAYRKGAAAERELMRLLWARGAAVIRSAGSGNSYSPDVVAIINGRAVAFECKAWSKSELFVRREQYEKMAEWSKRANTPVFIAWKYPRAGWFFIPLDYLEHKEKHYGIRLEDVRRLTTTLDVILG